METCTEGKREGSDRRSYASVEVFKEALRSLSPDDRARLMVIAKFFCRARIVPLAGGSIGPEDLLQEAIVRTLCGERRWPLDVPLIRFLDRTMESISSHIADREARHAHVDLDDDVSEDRLAEPSRSTKSIGKNSASEENVDRENRELLEAHFQDDPEAADVLRLRAEGHSSQEVRTLRGLSEKEWDTIRKRINRKLVQLIKARKREASNEG